MNTEVKKILRKYLVMGSVNCLQHPEETLKQAIEGGITAFQYREKGLNALIDKEKVELGWRLRTICKENGIPFFVNDDIDLVNMLEVDGIHVGQDDHHADKLREMYPEKIIGLSISTIEELNNSPISHVDYIGAGPMFPTVTKENAKKVAGPEWITTIKNTYPSMPVVGIGGINHQNAATVLKAGADGVAVSSCVTGARDIVQAVRNL